MEKKPLVSYLLSVLVFWIHCSSFENYRPLSSGVDFVSYLLQRTITPVAVPLFMIIAGALFYRDYTNEKYLSKIKRRITSLVIPFLLWNTINMVFNMIATACFKQYFIGRVPFEFSLSNILQGIFHYEYNQPFWFIFALIFFDLFAPVLNLIISNKYIGIIAIILTWIAANNGVGIPTPFSSIPLALFIIWSGDISENMHLACFQRKAHQRCSGFASDFCLPFGLIELLTILICFR